MILKRLYFSLRGGTSSWIRPKISAGVSESESQHAPLSKVAFFNVWFRAKSDV